MPNRQNHPEGVPLPLINRVLPPHLAEGAAAAFNDDVQERKADGAPLEFVKAHALLFSAKIIVRYVAGRLSDCVEWVRSDKELVSYRANLCWTHFLCCHYMRLQHYSALAKITLFLFAASALGILGVARPETYLHLLPILQNVALAIVISAIPFYPKSDENSLVRALHKSSGVLCFAGWLVLGFGLAAFGWQVNYAIYSSKTFILIMVSVGIGPAVSSKVIGEVYHEWPYISELLQEKLNEQYGKIGWFRTAYKCLPGALLETTKVLD